MKKLLVSMMLILGMLAFAAESAPSSTVGYVKYDLVRPSTGFNVIALPVDEGYSSSAEVGDAITSCTFISWYDAANQVWVGSDPDPFFGGWLNPFAVQTGMGLQVGVSAVSEFINDGDVVTIPAYDLVKPTTGFNVVMHPLTMAGITSSAGIGDDISNCTFISWYDAANQVWVGSDPDPFFGGWLNPFPTEIAMGLQVGVSAASSWPSAKNYEEVSGDSYTQPKGITKNIYYHVTDGGGAEYDFSAAPYDNITFTVWNEATPTEIFHETDAAAFYTVLGGTMGAVSCQIGAFATAWAVGDIITFKVKDETTSPVNYVQTGSTEGLVNDGLAQYNGWNGAPGTNTAPIQPTILDGIDGNTPLETSLEQNYPNPFNPTTSINFSMKNEGIAKLNVYNYTGQLVNSLVNGQMSAGYHTVNFDASNLSAGVYYYTLEANNMTMTNKMVLVK